MSKKILLSPIADSPVPIDDSTINRVEFADMVDRVTTVTSQVTEVKHAQQKIQQNQSELKLTINSILEKLNSIESHQHRAEKSSTMRDLSPYFRNQVPFLNSEPGFRDVDRVRMDEDRDHRYKLLKNVDFPVFTGTNLYGWIARVERYSRIAQFTEAQLIDQVSVSLADDALGWFNWEINRAPFLCWKNFKDCILLRFGNLRVKGPSHSLFCIRQSGTVGEYVKVFEILSAQVSGSDDNKLEGIFLNGLQPDMQELVFLMKPSSLPEMIAITLSMEDNQLRQCMNTSIVSKSNEKKSYFIFNKNNSNTLNTWSVKTLPLEQPHGQTKVATIPMQRPQRNHTRAELDELRVLTVIDDFVVEVLQDEDYVDSHEINAPAHCITLSLSSFMGVSSPITTKMKGLIRKSEVLFMLDSGATHNFITPRIASKLKLKESANTNLNILLDTRVIVKGSGICRNVSFTVQGWIFITDYITLDLGQVLLYWVYNG